MAFPLLTERGIPEDGPIRVMLMEHESERTLLADMMEKTTELPGRSKAFTMSAMHCLHFSTGGSFPGQADQGAGTAG